MYAILNTNPALGGIGIFVILILLLALTVAIVAMVIFGNIRSD